MKPKIATYQTEVHTRVGPALSSVTFLVCGFQQTNFQKGRQMWRLLRSSLMFFLLLLVFKFTSAQPTGGEPRQIHALVEAIQQRIASVSLQITKDPRDKGLFAARGSLYVKLYRTLYDPPSYVERYLAEFYGKKPPELAPTAIATKAIADLNEAITNSPSTDLYVMRGDMHDVRWSEEAWTISQSAGQAKNWPYDSWERLAELPTDWRQLAVLHRFLTNIDFRIAANDYSRALRLSKDANAVKEIQAKLGRLYAFRTERMPLELAAIKRGVVSANGYRYSIWADYDKAIEHMSKSDRALSECERWTKPKIEFVCQLYYAKGLVAATYDKYELALRSFNTAEEYIRKTDVSFLCDLYTARRNLHWKMKDFDAALAEVAKMKSEITKASCGDEGYEDYELRGDAAFAKSKWRAAIYNYTTAMMKSINPLDNVRKNRILAYLRLGEWENALEDLRVYCRYSCTPEEYWLRARAYRMVGQVSSAREDDETARRLKSNEEKDLRFKKRSGIVFGELRMPDGVQFKWEALRVRLVDAADESKVRWFQIDELLRFSTRYWKHRRFRIIASYEETPSENESMRFEGQTGDLIINKGKIGPLIIKLNRISRQ